MIKICLLLFISGLSVNHASTYCYEYYGSDTTCYNTIISDDYVGCYGFGSCYLSEITASASLQCDGYLACAGSDSIESTGSSVYCDGNYGCYYVDEISASTYLYCDGEYGCAYAENLSGNYIYCSGDFGCAYVRGDITANNWVSCDGKLGCYSADGTISGTYVYATANYAAYYTNIEATYDVYCGAKYACYYATINAGDDVMVEAKYAAYRATIDATDDVYCDAEYGCYYADITSGSQVWIDAKFGAYASDISAIYVYVYGSYGLYSADVTSVSGSSLYVYLFGYYSGYYGDIYALETSNTYDVYIFCYCDNACRYLDVYHYGALSKVYVYPTNCKDYEGTTNPDGVYCPSFTASTSMTKDEHSTMRQKQIKASEDYDKFKKQADEPASKAEQERKALEKEAKAKMAKADKIGQEGDRNQIFANVGLLETGKSALNMTTIYGMMFSAFLSFMITACYYSRFKDQGAKYEPLS